MTKNLEKIDAENEDFYKQSYDDVVSGNWSIKDIIGFELKGAKVFAPRMFCGHLAPSISSYCPLVQKPGISILSLLPLYDTLIYPIQTHSAGTKLSEKIFKTYYEISLSDFLMIAEQGRIIPYFVSAYKKYDVNLIQHFLEPGMPRISHSHMALIRRYGACKLVNGDCEKCKEEAAFAKKEVSKIVEEVRFQRSCSVCLSLAYSTGVITDKILQTSYPERTLCSVPDVLACRNLDAVLQTNCPSAMEALGLLTDFPETWNAVENIIDGLKVKYTPDLDFESYLELLDGKTTRAVRETTKRILEDPFAAKYSERLNSRIFAFNRELEEVARTRTAKFYQAVSDIAVYGGNKFVERQTQGYLRARKKNLQKISEWIASKLMDLHAKATGKDWTLAQLYRFRCKTEQCKKPSK